MRQFLRLGIPRHHSSHDGIGGVFVGDPDADRSANRGSDGSANGCSDAGADRSGDSSAYRTTDASRLPRR